MKFKPGDKVKRQFGIEWPYFDMTVTVKELPNDYTVRFEEITNDWNPALFDLVEKPKATVEEMKKVFEDKINRIKGLEKFNLCEMRVNGVFTRYMDPDTDNAWIGFCLGYHCAQHENNSAQ